MRSFSCSVKATNVHIPFKRLDFGETDVLDKFYNSDVAVVDMSVQEQQWALFYHVGMRESMAMPKTVILLHDTDPEFTLSVKVSERGVCGTGVCACVCVCEGKFRCGRGA